MDSHPHNRIESSADTGRRSSLRSLRARLGRLVKGGSKRAHDPPKTTPTPGLPQWSELEPPKVTVAVPVHNAFNEFQACIAAVLRNTRFPARILVADDASTDPRMLDLLDSLPGRGVDVMRSTKNRGFVETANDVFRSTTGDVVLLNSDTLVPPGWLTRMVAAAIRQPKVATVTALSNNAGAFSAPEFGRRNEVPSWLTSDNVGRLIAQTSGRIYPSGPTGNGFCMYFRRAALDEVGFFDSEAFPRGYGEENDFCMRSRAAGWKHVVDDSTYVLHDRSASFGGERSALAEAGQLVLDERWPEYRRLAQEFVRGDHLASARAAVAAAFSAPKTVRPRVLAVLHGGQGGTPASTRDLIDALDHRFDFLILRSDGASADLLERSAGSERLLERFSFDEPLRSTDFRRSDYQSIALHVLTRYAIELVHVRHLIGHTFDLPPVARSLGIPVVLSFHDFYHVCPTTHLIDENGVFCGGVCTPGEGPCRIPMSWVAAGMPDLKHSGVYEWRDRVAEMFQAVDAFVTTVPSVRSIHLEAFPQLAEAQFPVFEHGRDLPATPWKPGQPVPGEPIKILVAGNLDLHKGKAFLSALKAADQAGRLDFHFIGRLDPFTEALGVSHGPYERAAFPEMVGRINPTFAGLFSITAESYSHTLTEAWSMGLPVFATDLGAFRDRISSQGGGWLIDPSDPEGAYRLICSVADDAEEYDRRRTEVDQALLRTAAEMAVDYEALYKQHMGSAYVSVREPVRLGVVALGSGDRHPGSVHVRALRRYWHPALADRVVPMLLDPDRFVRHPQAVHLDAIIVERNGVPPEQTRPFLDTVRSQRLPFALDLDDDLIELPRSHPHYSSFGTDVAASLQALAEAARLITVSTAPLAQRLGRFGRVALVPNHLDEGLWMTPSPPRPSGSDAGVLRVLFFGNDSHQADLPLVQSAFEGVTSRTLTLAGIATPSSAPEWATALPMTHEVRQYPDFVAWLRAIAADFDVAIAPLVDLEWTRAKSDLKYLESTALHLPVLASDVEAYRDTIVDGQTGVLVPDGRDAWQEALESIARDSEHRTAMAERAYEYVKGNRLLGGHAASIVELLDDLAHRE